MYWASGIGLFEICTTRVFIPSLIPPQTELTKYFQQNLGSICAKEEVEAREEVVVEMDEYSEFASSNKEPTARGPVHLITLNYT